MSITVSWSKISCQDYFIDDFQLAKKKATNENKWIFVDFGAVWCNPCKLMDKHVFSDSTVRETLLKEYICLKLDFDKNKYLLKKYSVNIFPKYLILTEDGEQIYSWAGYTNKETFLKKLKSVPVRSVEKDDMDSLYRLNKTNKEFLYSYYDVLRKYNYNENASEIANKILRKEKNWQETRNMKLIIDNIDITKYKNYLLKNKNIFIQKFPADSINNLIFTYYQKNHLLADGCNPSPDLDAIKSDMSDLFGNSADYFISLYFLLILEDNNNQWNTFVYSLVYLMKQPNKIFVNDYYYKKLTKVLLRNMTSPELEEVYNGIKNQFGMNYDIDLKYYDLKALAEYKLGLKEEANLTLQSANNISLEKYKRPFDSILSVLISISK